MTPELRLIRYFVAVGQTGNMTRAAQSLHISQPSLSAAIKQLEAQLGVELLSRRGRRIAITPAGEQLLRSGRELLAAADSLVDEVRQRGSAPQGRLRLGLSPTARYGIGPRLLAASAGRLDLAVAFCAPDAVPGDVELIPLHQEPAVVHLAADHPLASRATLSAGDLADVIVLIAASRDSVGFSARILHAFSQAGVTPRTRADPYPDLGLQAVREGLGVVIYARSAFPPELRGSAFVPFDPPLKLPFQLAVRAGGVSGSVRAVVDVARAM